MEQITLNMIPKGITPMCHASQYDKGRHIRLNIMDGLQGYKLTDETAEIRVRKPDNNIVTAAGIYTAGTAYVDLFTTEQMTACEGDNECELRLTRGEQRIGSLNFKMRVEMDPLKDGIESETVIHNLEQQVADLVSEQYDADSVIFDDEPTEGHGTGYAVKSGGLKAYIPKAIGALDDVDIDSPAGNQALVWNPTTQKWENGEVSTVGSIDDLNDVDTSGKTAGDSLRFDPDAGEEGEWVAEPITIKMTTAEWEDIADKQAWRNAHKNTYLIITDAPNLNATAQQISYDGGADTVWDKVEANKSDITDLNTNKADKSALTWTLLGETTGTAEQMLPTTWNEIQVYGMFGGNAQYGFTAHAIKAHWGANPAKYIEGGADKDSGTDHHIAVWHIGSNAKIGLDFWRYNNTDYTSTSKLIVYYR